MSSTNFPEALNLALPKILKSIPDEWRGTTFKNLQLLGRGTFCERLQALVLSKSPSDDITSQELTELGNAEDYLRVSSNISSLLELTLATRLGYADVSLVFSFASAVMPLMALLYTAHPLATVHLFLAGAPSPFSASQLELLPLLNVRLQLHAEAASPSPDLSSSSSPHDIFARYVPLFHAHTLPSLAHADSQLHAVVAPFFLGIRDASRVPPAPVAVIRKRMTSPLTTPLCEALLALLSSDPSPTSTAAPFPDLPAPDADSLAGFHGHLQEMSGAPVDAALPPLVCTTGLAALSTLWLSFVLFRGGADVVMASTSYGGSSELTDLLAGRGVRFHKSTYDITGRNEITPAIRHTLSVLAQKQQQESADVAAGSAARASAVTVLLVEIPTNPDMKVPEVADLVGLARAHEAASGRPVVLVLDTTFAPASRVLSQLHALDAGLPALAFISLSKSVSRGLTTGGAVVAGAGGCAREVLGDAHRVARMLDTPSRADQLRALAANHGGVEERCARAYAVAREVGAALQAAVRAACGGHEMPLAFVSEGQAALGFSSSTFSFNLPAVEGAAQGVNEGLAQRFVDLITEQAGFKPCVSFGQDNGLVYATVPATSTQGAIKAEDKAKQAIGGVQLTRLSFPPQADVAHLIAVITNAIQVCYSK